MTETRKIAAILAADIVGFSRLTSADEDRTLARLRTLRSELIDPAVISQNGRVFKRTGDGALVEFRSVVEAVRFAITIQNGMIERNAGMPPGQHIDFRIGIHLSDVVEESDGDLMGDGVNIAARLEGIAKPGAICLSEDAFRQVKGRLDLAIIDLGPIQLKNIAEPVRAYSLQVYVPAQIKQAPPIEPNLEEKHSVVLALPDKPSIAVLPFRNMSGDPEQDYFADGMVEEIITGLSRIKWLFVISRNSTFNYKGKPVDVKAIGRELGVRYVLEGSVRRSGDQLRVTGQLIETEAARQVWADRYDGALGDIFTLQDEITISVIGAIEPTLRKAEVERARRKRPDNLDAYDLLLRALPFAATGMPESTDKALPLLEAAIRLEADYALAHALIAWCHEQRYLRGGLHAETREAALKHARLAITSGSDDAMALAMGAFVVAVVERDFVNALDAVDRALVLSPSSALAFGFSSMIRAWMGESARAIEHARISIRLSPYDPLIYLPYVGLAYAHFFAGEWTEAANAANRASQANPQLSVPCFILTGALIRLGRVVEAKSSANRLLELHPSFTVNQLISGSPVTKPEHLADLADALRQAELPE